MDRGDHFSVVGQKIWPIQTETLRPVFRHLSCIRAPSGALEKNTSTRNRGEFNVVGLRIWPIQNER